MEVWFKTGNEMQDGTPRTVKAESKVQYEEYIEKGWKPIKDNKKVEVEVKVIVGDIPEEVIEEMVEAVSIDWLNIIVEQTTKKGIKAKLKDMGIKAPKGAKEAELLKLVQDNLGEINE